MVGTAMVATSVLHRIHVHDAGDTVVTAQALRLCAALGARVTTANPVAAVLDDGHPLPWGDGRGADVVLGNAPSPGDGPVTVVVHGLPHPATPDQAERYLQEEYGLAALTGDSDGPPLLTAGWPALLHAGAWTAAAALLGLVAVARAGKAGRARVDVDARGMTAWMLDDALVRAARGLRPRGRTRGADELAARGRLVHVADGWVSLSPWHPGDWATLAAWFQATAAVPAEGEEEDDDLRRRAIAAMARHRRDEVQTGLWELRLPGGAGLAPEEVLSSPLWRRWGSVAGEVVASPVAGALAPQPPPPWRWPAPCLPLDGVVVVEIAGLWAAPAATAVLAEWGARVLKVEAPRRLDGFRGGDGTRFATFNRGKESLLLDLSDAEGRAALEGILATADLMVEAQAPRVLANWGLDGARMRTAFPHLAVVHLPAFAAPPQSWPQPVAVGLDLEMLCGQALLSPSAPVRPCGVPLADCVAAAAGTAAALAALWRRLDDGGVAHLRLAQADVLLHHLAPRLVARRRRRRWPGDGLAGVAASTARQPVQLLEDAELRAAGGLVEVVDADGALRPYPRPAILLDGRAAPPAPRAPAPGERRRRAPQ